MISQRGIGKKSGALVASLLLSGCALPALLRPAPAPPPQDARLAPSETLRLPDGRGLPARVWTPPAGTAPLGTILALHGYTDSRDAWEVPAPGFAAAGWTVVAPDQEGFGETATRGNWAGTDRMVADAAALVRLLRARAPGLPVVVMGESMGGAVATVLAAPADAPQDATVLISPAVWGWGQMSASLALTLRGVDAVAPGWRPEPGQIGRDIRASDNIDALIRMGRDPLTLRRPAVSTMKGLVDLMAAAQDAAPALHGRVLYLTGTRDRIVPSAATAAAWAKLPASVRRGVYPNGYHLLLRDRDGALVAADILAWLANPDAWLPSGADVAAGAWASGQMWDGRPFGLLPAAVAGSGMPSVWPY